MHVDYGHDATVIQHRTVLYKLYSCLYIFANHDFKTWQQEHHQTGQTEGSGFLLLFRAEAPRAAALSIQLAAQSKAQKIPFCVA